MQDFAFVKLLIEPVWNRNTRRRAGNWSYGTAPFNRTSLESKLIRAKHTEQQNTLLIEPVWNRNLCRHLQLPSLVCLLIEPVWNRNLFLQWLIGNGDGTFNRTSLESKHSFTHRGTGIASLLLIEPVWNRN